MCRCWPLVTTRHIIHFQLKFASVPCGSRIQFRPSRSKCLFKPMKLHLVWSGSLVLLSDPLLTCCTLWRWEMVMPQTEVMENFILVKTLFSLVSFQISSSALCAIVIERLLASLFESCIVPQSEQDSMRAMPLLFGPFIFDVTLPFPFSSSLSPLAWYFYQYHRILQYGKPPESSQRPFFWMFVDNLVLEKEDRETASRFFKVHRKSSPSPDCFFFTSCLLSV